MAKKEKAKEVKKEEVPVVKEESKEEVKADSKPTVDFDKVHPNYSSDEDVSAEKVLDEELEKEKMVEVSVSSGKSEPIEVEPKKELEDFKGCVKLKKEIKFVKGSTCFKCQAKPLDEEDVIYLWSGYSNLVQARCGRCAEKLKNAIR